MKKTKITVDDYLQKQASPQREILIQLRKLIKKTLPGIREEMKMGVPWYEGKFYLVALKDHVNLGFACHQLPEKHQKELEGKGKFMRHIKFFSPKKIDRKKLIKLMGATQKGYRNPHPKKK